MAPASPGVPRWSDIDARERPARVVDTDVYSEKEFYSQQSENLASFIRLVGYPLTFLTAIGAIFGALNTMYSSVSARGKEIATLRALGFGPLSILTSTIIESATLAVLGGLFPAIRAVRIPVAAALREL